MFFTLSNHIFDFILKEKVTIVFRRYNKIQNCQGTDSLICNFPKLRPKICCIKTSTLELTSFGLNFSKETFLRTFKIKQPPRYHDNYAELLVWGLVHNDAALQEDASRGLP